MTFYDFFSKLRGNGFSKRWDTNVNLLICDNYGLKLYYSFSFNNRVDVSLYDKNNHFKSFVIHSTKDDKTLDELYNIIISRIRLSKINYLDVTLS